MRPFIPIKLDAEMHFWEEVSHLQRSPSGSSQKVTSSLLRSYGSKGLVTSSRPPSEQTVKLGLPQVLIPLLRGGIRTLLPNPLRPTHPSVGAPGRKRRFRGRELLRVQLLIPTCRPGQGAPPGAYICLDSHLPTCPIAFGQPRVHRLRNPPRKSREKALLPFTAPFAHRIPEKQPLICLRE